jgi:hypothetical protein
LAHVDWAQRATEGQDATDQHLLCCCYFVQGVVDAAALCMPALRSLRVFVTIASLALTLPLIALALFSVAFSSVQV